MRAHGLDKRVTGVRAIHVDLPGFMRAFTDDASYARVRADFVEQVRPLVAAGAEVPRNLRQGIGCMRGGVPRKALVNRPVEGQPQCRRASVPIPKFASLSRSLVCELRNRRTLATY